MDVNYAFGEENLKNNKSKSVKSSSNGVGSIKSDVRQLINLGFLSNLILVLMSTLPRPTMRCGPFMSN
jgi:hypothetical protein